MSSSDVSGWMHSRYGLENEHLYSFWSSDSQNQGAFLRILSASNLFGGKTSSFKNDTVGSIQLDPTLICWMWAAIPFTFVGLHKSSTRMTRGRLCAEEDVSVTRESACVFPFLEYGVGWMTQISTAGAWLELNTLAFSHLWLLAPLLLGQWPVLSLIAFLWHIPPFFEPWTFLPTKSHTQPCCLWLRIPILVISQWWASRARSKLAPLQSPFNLPHHQHIPSRREILARRLCQPILHPCFVLLIFPLTQVQWTRPQDLPVLDPWQRCRACIWCQKPLKRCPTLQFSLCNQHFKVWPWVEV